MRCPLQDSKAAATTHANPCLHTALEDPPRQQDPSQALEPALPAIASKGPAARGTTSCQQGGCSEGSAVSQLTARRPATARLHVLGIILMALHKAADLHHIGADGVLPTTIVLVHTCQSASSEAG